MPAICGRKPSAAAPTHSPACVPKELLASTTRSSSIFCASSWAFSSSSAATKPTAPTSSDAPTGMRNGRYPVARWSAMTCAAAASRVRSPEKTTSAPKRRSRKRFPVSTTGGRPPSTSTQRNPQRAAAAAVWRAWFDCTAPSVMRVSAPCRSASATLNSSLRVLFPPPPRPVRSSRLTSSRRRPRTRASLGSSSSGVGSWARRILGTVSVSTGFPPAKSLARLPPPPRGRPPPGR